MNCGSKQAPENFMHIQFLVEYFIYVLSCVIVQDAEAAARDAQVRSVILTLLGDDDLLIGCV